MSDERLRRDELASAYLDGEATPAETAEVEADDALLDRVEQLRSVRGAVAAQVPPLSSEQRDRMIGAALAAAESDTETAADAESGIQSDSGRGARFVLLRRPEILVLAAAAALLAAVASASLITSRDGDYDEAATAAEGTTAADADEPAAAERAEAPAQELMAEADDAADMAPETTIAPAEEAMAEAAMALDEGLTAEAAAAPVEFDDEAEMIEAATEEAVTEVDVTTTERHDDSAEAATDDSDQAAPVVDLGSFESLESLLKRIGASQTESLEDGATAEPGQCSAAVLELDAETLQSFTATVGTEDPVAFDARLVRQADGTLLVVYAASPDCQAETHEPDSP